MAYTNGTYQREKETVESVLAQARQEQWHIGIQRGLYEHYKARILRVTNDRHKKDEALVSLRKIFGIRG